MAVLKSFCCELSAHMYTLLYSIPFKYEYCLSLSIFTAGDELHWGDEIHWLSSMYAVSLDKQYQLQRGRGIFHFCGVGVGGYFPILRGGEGGGSFSKSFYLQTG